MPAFRLTQISDTHLARRLQKLTDNFHCVSEHIDATRPDLIVNTGDLAFDAPTSPDDLKFAKELHDALPVPCRHLPGNHDVGDNPTGGDTAATDVVSTERRGRWLDAVGPDRWVVDRAGWTLLGLDAQLFDSGLAAESEQWAWLAAQLDARSVDGSIALVLHKPLTAPATELAAAPPYRFVPPKARRRLDDLLGGRRVPLVLSGHVHQFRVIETAARRHVWVPTTWAVLPDQAQLVLGAKRCGVVSVTLGPNGQAAATLVEPAGLAQLTLTRDIPDPYAA
jgi:3',5'-cyclic AMP phosphodiesterase CpdA